MDFLLRLLTWWNSQTLGTQIFTSRHGIRVGEDEQGNIYYRDAADKRRWVIYNGESEASRIAPGWYGWMHHTVDVSPTEATRTPRTWEKPHQENRTGTPAAYAPPGSIRGAEPVARRDYEAWRPE